MQKHSDTDFEGGFSLTFSQCFFLISTNCQSFLEYCTSKPLFSKSLEFCNVKGTESAKAKELEGEKNHVNVEEIHFFNCRGGGYAGKGRKKHPVVLPAIRPDNFDKSVKRRLEIAKDY